MTDLILHRASSLAIAPPLPEPRHGSVVVRPAVGGADGADFKFIDALQKKHNKQVGFLRRDGLVNHIAAGRVLIAEEGHVCVGYCVSSDKYLKREELGICYQLNVVPGKQRGLIGATLIKEVFNRAAYGCRLFCCWCAQDLQANHFWESMGFLPIAFRTGSRTAGSKKTPRIHIFWQRRIREGDAETPYWFPSETKGGSIGEARLVLPIPPGTHWSDVKPAVLPGMENVNVLPPGTADPSVKKTRAPKAKPVVVKPPTRPKGGLWFAPPQPAKGSPEAKAAAKAEKSKREKPPRFKHDPKLVEAARELRDKYTEQINSGMLLPPSSSGKYDVSRQLDTAPSAMEVAPVALLNAA